jgi:hypothetical protein
VYIVLGGFWGVTQLSFMEVDLGHCVNVFWWFLGSKAIFFYGRLIWGTVWMILGVFWRVTQFSFMVG